MLPSQLNGAEYPSERAIVAHLDQYKLDRTGGPRGQLSVHPAAGQFVLHNAACDVRPGGINAVDALLHALKSSMHSTAGKNYSMHLRNGYLALPDCPPELQNEVLTGLRKSLHLLRCLGMQDVCACGLDATLEAASAASHKVTLVYASAVPVQAYLNYGKADRGFQEEVSWGWSLSCFLCCHLAVTLSHFEGLGMEQCHGSHGIKARMAKRRLGRKSRCP